MSTRRGLHSVRTGLKCLLLTCLGSAHLRGAFGEEYTMTLLDKGMCMSPSSVHCCGSFLGEGRPDTNLPPEKVEAQDTHCPQFSFRGPEVCSAPPPHSLLCSWLSAVSGEEGKGKRRNKCSLSTLNESGPNPSLQLPEDRLRKLMLREALQHGRDTVQIKRPGS